MKFLFPEKEESVRSKLNLQQFKKVYIQKAYGLGISLYVVTFNSRFPTIEIPISKMKETNISKVIKMKGRKKTELRFSIPIELDYYTLQIPNNAIIVYRDMGARFYVKY